LNALDKLLKGATAGDPITGLKWTRKTCRKLASELKRKGFQVEHSTIPRLAQILGYTLRGNRKRLSRKQDDRRDQQMRYIEKQRKRFARKKQPEISVDGKKKKENRTISECRARVTQRTFGCFGNRLSHRRNRQSIFIRHL
jgi:transposase-like protein